MKMRLPSNSDPAPTDDKRAAAAHQAFWRGLDELEASQPGITAGIHDPVNWHRRELMKLMAASLALAGTPGCSRPPLEQIVPYRQGPPQSIDGKPVFYASAIARDGYGTGVLVETNMGRPTKIEGNPLHPASLGATDIFAQAAVLELWDPDRSKTVLHDRSIATWEGFLVDLQSRLRGSADASRMGGASRMNRLYVAEGTPGVTGAIADHRRVTRTSDIAALVDALAGRIGGRFDAARTPAASDAWLDAVAADLLQHPGA